MLFSTTEGRARFPDFLQLSFGEKAVIGFDRYGRAIGAVVPMEAVRILADLGDTVDEDVRLRIKRAAQTLLREAPGEGSPRAFLNEAAAPLSISEVEAKRAAHRRGRAAAAKAKPKN